MRNACPLALLAGLLLPLALPAGATTPCADYHTRIIERANIPIGGQGQGYGDLPEMAKVGHRIYVAAPAHGIVEIDVQDPLQPVELGTIPLAHNARSIVTNGSILFAGGDGSSGSWVTAIDVSSGVQVLSTLQLGSQSQFESLTLDGNLLYAAALVNGMFIVDVTNPSSMAVRSQYTVSGAGITGVAVSGATAYVTRAGVNQGGLDVVDVSDPDAPVSIGFDRAYPQRDRFSPVLDGTNVYTVYRSNCCPRIFQYDVADPTQPTEVGEWEVSYAHRIRKVGDRLYATGSHTWDFGYGGIAVFDLANMASGPLGELRPYGGRDILVEAPYAYVSTYYGGFDVTEILDEVTVFPSGGSEIGPDGSPFPVDVLEFQVHGNLAVQLELAEFETGYGYQEYAVRTLDVTDPHDITTVEHRSLPEEALYRSDSRADLAVATSSRGLETIGVSPLAFVGWTSIAGAVDVALSGSTAYVSTSAGGIEVVDVTDPLLPVAVGNAPTAGSNGEVEVADGYLYVTDNVDGLQIFDVSSPHAPVKVASAVLPEGTEGLEVLGRHVFAKNATSGNLYAVDVSVPESPAVVGTTTLRGGSARLEGAAGSGVLYGMFFQGLTKDGFEVVDVSEPTAPSSIESIYEGHVGADQVAVLGDELLLFSQQYIHNFPRACEGQAVSAPDMTPATQERTRLVVIPNPFVSFTEIRFAMAPDHDAIVTVHDVQGRLVRSLTAAVHDGQGTATWDGRDGRGRNVSPGVYFVRLTGGASPARVVRLR